jgi:GNAT superfamily N-acetyltransferase
MTLAHLVDELQRQATDAVAFYPRAALERAIDRDEIQLAFENGEPCGYLWRGPLRAGRDAVIYQAVIHYDLRRRTHGAQLVAELEHQARVAGATGIRLRCRADLEANEFWRSLGFNCIAVGHSGIRRNTDVNTWHRPLQAGLFDDLTVEPSSRRRERSAYRLATGPMPNRYNRHRRVA